ncbi:MAG: DNRLRE domain-containing protein, partial [Coriobacteriia bacterium]|nr:DNRLRE domain-containing protein [Coriobacteriia bacterium]
MRARLRTRLLRAVSALAAVSLAGTAAFSSSGAAFATESLAPMQTAALEPEETTVSTPTRTVATPQAVDSMLGGSEIPERRTQFARHYRMSDGTMRAEIFAEPVNYRDDTTGRMLPIDSSLDETTAAGVAVSRNRANVFRTTLPGRLGTEWVSVETTRARVSLRPSRTPAPLAVESAAGPVAASKVASDTRRYAEAFSGVTLEYRSTSTGVKEDIILAAPGTGNVFSFDLSCPGLVPVLQNDGSVALTVPGATSPTVVMPPPCMWDSSADAESGFSSDVRYELTRGLLFWRLDVVASKAWLDDPVRVYPVTIDPAMILNVAGVPAADTYVSSKYPTTNYAGSALLYACFNTACYGYVKPPADPFFSGATKDTYRVTNATFGMQNTEASGHGVTAWRITVPWTSTKMVWANRDLAVVPIPNGRTVQGAGQRWEWNVTEAVKLWQQGTALPYGFKMWSDTPPSQNVRLGFRSKEAGTQIPSMTVLYVAVPTAAVTSPAPDAAISPDSPVTWTYGNETQDPQSFYRVEIATLPSGPAVATNQYSGDATSAPLPIPPGGWRGDTTYYVRVQVAASPSELSEPLWSLPGSWRGFRIAAPAPVSAGVSAVRGLAWHTETDVNGDGIPENPADNGSAGRGAVDLSWPSAGSIASGYRIYMSDGDAWRGVATTTATSWTSAGAGLYPTDSAIASRSAEATSSPYLSGIGLDLRDDPTPLYAKTAGTTLDAFPGYLFKVVPFNIGGETPLSQCPTVTVQLPSRSVGLNRAPRHAEIPLESAAGHGLASWAESGTLVAGITDLAIDSYGPPAAVSRTYLSDVSDESLFARGWRFDFERSIETSTATETAVTYVDAAGDRIVFRGTGTDTWFGPKSVPATLTTTQAHDSWTLESKGTSATFDAQGRLTSVLTRGVTSPVDYEWVADASLHITASNGHEIVVGFLGSDDAKRVVSAEYSRDTTAGALTRRVEYGAQSVTTRAGEDGEYTTSYAYDTSGRLTGLSVDGFASAGADAVWSFAYDASGRLERVDPPQAAGHPDRYETLAYVGNVCSVSRPARVDSTDTTATETYVVNPDGSLAAHGIGATSAASRQGTETIEYGVYGGVVLEQTAAGVRTMRTFDVRGNCLSETDGAGRTNRATYGALDLPDTVTDPKGAVSTYTYEPASGYLLTLRRSLSATQSAETSWTYLADGSGRLDSESRLLDSSGAVAVTDYGAYGDFAQPGSVTQRDVRLSSGPDTE